MEKRHLGFVLLSLLLTGACSYSAKPTGGSVLEAHSGINRGDDPPDFSVATIDGKQYSLADFRNQKPVLLYFWASWCPYCKQDLSVAREVYPKYADRVKFIAIDLDTNEDAALIGKYKEKMKLEGIDLAQGNVGILSDYNVIYTTTKYAIGRSGKIIYKGSGVFTKEQWETLLNGLAES